MKRLLLLLTTLASLTLQAQKTKPAHKVSVGVSFSPDYCFRTLHNNDGSSSSDVVISNRNDIEVAKFGYTTGFNVLFNLTGSVALETGIQYSNKGFKTGKMLPLAPSPDPAVPITIQTVYIYHYVGIPLKIKFRLGEGKVHFQPGIGCTANFLMGAKTISRYEYSNRKTGKKYYSTTFDLKRFDLSPMVSAGFGYTLNKKVHLFAEPAFRYGLINTKDVQVTEHLWSAGLNFGFYYSLK